MLASKMPEVREKAAEAVRQALPNQVISENVQSRAHSTPAHESLLSSSLWRLWAGEKPLGLIPLEPLERNPGKHEDQYAILKEFTKELLVKGRKWFWLIIDGNPHISMHKLYLTPEFPIRMRVAALHEYMTMLKSFQDLIFPIIGKVFAKTQGYTTDQALE